MLVKELTERDLEDIDSFNIDVYKNDETYKEVVSFFKKEEESYYSLEPGEDVIDYIRKNIAFYSEKSDSELIQFFFESFDFQENFDISKYGSSNRMIISKNNHGFWEKAVISLVGFKSNNLRSQNVGMLHSRLVESRVLPIIFMASNIACQNDEILIMRSLSTGSSPFSKILNQESEQLDSIRRGVLLGYLSSLPNRVVKEKTKIIDSYNLNKFYESGGFKKILDKQVTEKTAILFFAPHHISELSLNTSSSCDQYYLAISPSLAFQNWEIQITNFIVVIKELIKSYENIVVFFQGAALGPVISQYLDSKKEWNVSFFDLGRLLDLEVEYSELKKTGSPLPSKKLIKSNVFVRSSNTGKCFQFKKE